MEDCSRVLVMKSAKVFHGGGNIELTSSSSYTVGSKRRVRDTLPQALSRSFKGPRVQCSSDEPWNDTHRAKRMLRFSSQLQGGIFNFSARLFFHHNLMLSSWEALVFPGDAMHT